MSERLNLLQSYLKESPEDPFLHFAIAQEYAKLENWQAAREKYAYIHEFYPAYVGNYYHFAQLLERFEEEDAARKIYEQGIAIAEAAKDMHAASELRMALSVL